MSGTIDIYAILQYGAALGLVAMVGAVIRNAVVLGRHDVRLDNIETDVKEIGEKANAALYNGHAAKRGRRR